MKFFNKLLLSFSLLWLIFVANTAIAQSSMSFKIDGNNFMGTVETATLININEENYIQIKAVNKERLVFLYLKEKLLKGEFPVTLKYKAHDHEKGQTPDAELVWAPGGGEQPPWNTIEGEAVITLYDSLAKTVSGTFNFVVQKQDFSTKKDQKKERVDIEKGMISNIQFVVDATSEVK
ncbi:MAG: hypothetical protein CVV24_09080 [Ignavibacteriae bacterium HGW-Ignavibacteriae-3]|nr:MAG: hypothetical protein CVV24_09080 [Ignavibacteriae bacterium HGW-Ignavibacteriae-3]